MNTHIDIDEQVKLLKIQINISTSEAKKLLNIHEGDIFKSVLDFYKFEEKKENPFKDSDDDNPHKILYELRQISDEKDNILQKLIEKKKKKK